MTDRITKGSVETAAKRLNDAAEALGMDRRFIVWFGSATMGTAHELAESHPGLHHPIVTKIGKTYGDAERYLSSMRHALESVKHDRDYRREDTLNGAVSGNSAFEPQNVRRTRESVGIFDPDARSATRATEDRASHPKG